MVEFVLLLTCTRMNKYYFASKYILKVIKCKTQFQNKVDENLYAQITVIIFRVVFRAHSMVSLLRKFWKLFRRSGSVLLKRRMPCF